MNRPTILKKLKNVGFCCLSRLRKKDLEELMTGYVSNGTIPEEHIKKNQKIKSLKTQENVARSYITTSDRKMIRKDICSDNSKLFKPVALRDYQQHVVNFLSRSKRKGMLIFHSVGTGKTITALAAASCLAAKTGIAANRIIIIAPSSVKGQWIRQVNAVLPLLKEYITVESHERWLQKFSTGQETANNAILIIDEAHKFRSAIRDTIPVTGKFSKKMIQAAFEAKKVLFLTATPIVNTLDDIRNMVAVFKEFDNSKEAYEEFKSVKKSKSVSEYLKCFISAYSRPVAANDPSFPNVQRTFKKFVMSEAYYEKYIKVEQDDLEEFVNTARSILKFPKKNGSLMAFFSGVRRAVNAVTMDIISEKIKWLCKKIKLWNRNNEPCVIYSGWRAAGMHLLEEYLKKNDIAYATISGSKTSAARQRIVSEYNTKKFACLLITAAGSEGLDLKETRHLVILEPHWNQMRIEQTIGRAVRYKSHDSIANPLDRVVHVWHLILVKPTNDDDLPSADELLTNMAIMKQRAIEDIHYQDLIAASIEENVRACKS